MEASPATPRLLGRPAPTAGLPPQRRPQARQCVNAGNGTACASHPRVLEFSKRRLTNTVRYLVSTRTSRLPRFNSYCAGRKSPVQLLNPQPASLRQQSQTAQSHELGLVGIDTLLLSTQRPDRQAGLSGSPRFLQVVALTWPGLGLGFASAKRLGAVLLNYSSQLLPSPGAHVDPSAVCAQPQRERATTSHSSSTHCTSVPHSACVSLPPQARLH